ncbi:MAG: autotransporter domain-containing protein [Verrucomicrobiota bacterium]
MKTPLLLTTALLALTAAASAQTPRSFTGQYTFGDSLSDSGNLYALTGRQLPPAPYFNGRFSNGPVFTELLGNPTFPGASASSTRGSYVNFAVGGSNAGLPNGLPTLDQQIGIYRNQGFPAKPTDLFTVLAGANDLFSVLPGGISQPATLEAFSSTLARVVALNVQTLVALGAKNILVGGMPNLGATPYAVQVGGGASSPLANAGLRATNAFNATLRQQIGTMAATSADVNFVYFDMQAIFERILVDYRTLGFNNVSSYYLAAPGLGGGVGDPNSYVFWDDIHPSAKTHALLASIVVELLNPEMPLGFNANLGSAALALQGLASGAVSERASQLAVSNRPAGKTEVYARFDYGDGSRARDAWRSSFDYTGYVFTAGSDMRLTDGVFVGGAFNTGRMKAVIRRGGGDFTMEDTGGKVYAVWRGGPVSLIADGGYGFLRAKDIQRTTSFGGLQSRGKTTGDRWGVGIKAAWELPLQRVNIRPWFGLRTDRIVLDGYSEKDASVLAMDFEEQEARTSSGAIGVDASLGWKLGGRTLRLDGRAAWHGELGNRTRTVAGKLSDNFTRTTTLTLEDGDGSGVELGGAATLFLSNNWSASLGYAADIRAKEKLASRGTLSLQTGF